MEQARRRIRDIMDDIFEYPHMPYWFTVRQAIDLLQKMSGPGSTAEPATILVFDEKYNLLGALDMRSILRGLAQESGMVLEGEACPDPAAMAGVFCGGAAGELLEKPVSAYMVAIHCFLDADDDAPTAAAHMVKYNLGHLPVLENKRKLVGIVRMARVFGEISQELLA